MARESAPVRRGSWRRGCCEAEPSVILLEARDRLGGRINTAEAGMELDAGSVQGRRCSWRHPGNRLSAGAASEADPRAYLVSGRWSRIRDVRGALLTLICKCDKYTIS